jgi:hypothetical protein
MGDFAESAIIIFNFISVDEEIWRVYGIFVDHASVQFPI